MVPARMTFARLALRGVRLVPVLAVFLFLPALGGCQDRSTGLERGDVAPDFVLPTPDGTVRKLSNFRGRPVLLNLWATWCPPCIAEMPVLNAIAEEYGPKGLAVLGLAGDEDAEEVRTFLASEPVKFEVLLDRNGEVGTQYGITGYPETFLLDREGRVRMKFIGPVPILAGKPRADFVAQIEALLAN